MSKRDANPVLTPRGSQRGDRPPTRGRERRTQTFRELQERETGRRGTERREEDGRRIGMEGSQQAHAAGPSEAWRPHSPSLQELREGL